MTGGVETSRVGPVLRIVLNRPAKRNAVNAELARGLEAAIDELESDPAILAGVLGANGPVFCAGADLAVMAAGGRSSLWTEDGGFAGIVRKPRGTPLIAAVDGPALAGGLEIVLACDLVVASTRATFGLPEVTRSLVPVAGGVFRLPRRIPRNIALEMILTAEPIGADRAYAMGLVNRLVEAGTALDEAVALGTTIARHSPTAVRESLAYVRSLDGDEAEHWSRTEATAARVREGPDAREGLAAFVEGRPPRWSP